MVCFVFSRVCVFFFPFQIGRSALVTSSSSLPSFPSTLSWSRDESARRVKYTLTVCSLEEGQCSWALCASPGPPVPPLTAFLSRMRQRFPQVSQHSSMQAHTRTRTHTSMRVCRRQSPSYLTPHCSVSLTT